MIRLALILATLAMGTVALAVLALAGGAFLDPTASLIAVVGSAVWAPFGPHLLLASVVGVAFAALARRKGLRLLGGMVLVVAVAGIVAGAFILGQMVSASTAAGARIDWIAALVPRGMDQPAPDHIETVRTVGQTDLRAAVYLPPPSQRPAPVIVYIHGGGFKTGSFTETAADLRWFADQGWLVFSVEYRLFEAGRPTWDQAPEDVACALVWVGRNAARFGGDPDRLALAGDSAGGNLAVNLGHAAAAGSARACGAAPPVPDAIAVLYPALDPLSIYGEGFPIPGFEPHMLIEGYIGGSPDTFPDRIAAVTSETFLTPRAPPTLIVLPEQDSLVVARGTRGYVEAAGRVGADVSLVVIPFANHVFNQIAAGSLGNQIARTIRQRFLSEHLR